MGGGRVKFYLYKKKGGGVVSVSAMLKEGGGGRGTQSFEVVLTQDT